MAASPGLRVVIVGAGMVGLSQARHFAAQPLLTELDVASVTLVDSKGFEYSRRHGLSHEELAPTIKAAGIITNVPPQGSEALHSQGDLFRLGMHEHCKFRRMFPRVYAEVSAHKAYAQRRSAKELNHTHRAQNAPSWINGAFIRHWEDLNPTKEDLLVDTELYCKQHVEVLRNSGKVTYVHGTVIDVAFKDGGGFTSSASTPPLSADYRPQPQPSRVKLVTYEIANSIAMSDSMGERMYGETAVLEADIVVLALGLGAFRIPALSRFISAGLDVPDGKFQVEGAPMAFFGYHLLKKPDTPNGKLIALYLFEQNLPEATEFYVRDDGVLYVHWEIKKLRGFEVNNEKLLRTAKEEIMSMLCDVVHKYFPESLVGPRHDETRIVFGGVCEYPSVLVCNGPNTKITEYDHVLCKPLGSYKDGVSINTGLAHRGIQLGPAVALIGYYQIECGRLGVPPPEAEIIAKELLEQADIIEFALHRALADGSVSKSKLADYSGASSTLQARRRSEKKDAPAKAPQEHTKEFVYEIDNIDPRRHLRPYVYPPAVVRLEESAKVLPIAGAVNIDEEGTESVRGAYLKRPRNMWDSARRKDESSGIVEVDEPEPEPKRRRRASLSNRCSWPEHAARSLQEEKRPKLADRNAAKPGREASKTKSLFKKNRRPVESVKPGKGLLPRLELVLPPLITADPSGDGTEELDNEPHGGIKTGDAAALRAVPAEPSSTRSSATTPSAEAKISQTGCLPSDSERSLKRPTSPLSASERPFKVERVETSSGLMFAAVPHPGEDPSPLVIPSNIDFDFAEPPFTDH